MIPLRDINPSLRVPVVNIILIVVNVLAFFYELSLGPELPRFLMHAAFVPGRIGGPHGGGMAFAAQSVLVSMFLHGGWAHIGGNMLFLWIFGDNVEDRLGHLRYAIFYLLSGFAAALTHAWADPRSALPAIGASGAISGVLGAYVVLYPRARVVTMLILGFFVRLIEVPAYVYLPIWFLIQFLSGLASLGGQGSEGGVAWFAHIGGFIAGPVLLLLLGGLRRRRRAATRPWS